ncbi:MAG: hypothetical protein HYX78_10070 [Armatimonadetes bacterium]|nr:hypothetical protein [Armatimonadota bacterium]
MSSASRNIIFCAMVVCLIAVSFSAFGGVKVFIKTNPKNRAMSDVFLKDYKTGKVTKLVTVRDVNIHYHPAEYHNGHLYIIRRPGGKEVHVTNPNWTDELWRYTQNGRGTKLWSSKGFDFRVRDDEGMIAVLSHSGQVQGLPRSTLYLLNRDRKPIKIFRAEQLVKTDISFERWYGRFLWLKDQEEMDISGFVRLDSDSMTIKKYDLSRLRLSAEDYSLNTKSLQLVYSDYPVLLDIYDGQDFEKNKTPVNLYWYDLQTKHRRFIARTIAKRFDPKWVDSSTLEYNNPRGKGRIRKRIR